MISWRSRDSQLPTLGDQQKKIKPLRLGSWTLFSHPLRIFCQLTGKGPLGCTRHSDTLRFMFYFVYFILLLPSRCHKENSTQTLVTLSCLWKNLGPRGLSASAPVKYESICIYTKSQVSVYRTIGPLVI